MKYYLIIVGILIIFVLAGCAQEMSVPHRESNSLNTNAVEEFLWMAPGVAEECGWYEDGPVCVIGEKIYRLDKASMELRPFCAMEGCQHKSSVSCPSVVPKGTVVGSDGGRLYAAIFEDDGMYIQLLSLAEMTRRPLLKIQVEDIEMVVSFSGGYCYFATNTHESDCWTVTQMRVALIKDSIPEVMWKNENAFWKTVSVESIQSDDSLVFTEMVYWEDSICQNAVTVYDLSAKEQLMDREMYMYSPWHRDGEIYFCNNARDSIDIFDIQQREVVESIFLKRELNGAHMLYDEHFIYVIPPISFNKICVYNFQGELLCEIDLCLEKLRPDLRGNGYFQWLCVTDTSAFMKFSTRSHTIKAVFAIDKAAIENGGEPLVREFAINKSGGY